LKHMKENQNLNPKHSRKHRGRRKKLKLAPKNLCQLLLRRPPKKRFIQFKVHCK
uniref:60S ribosomal protein L29 n=1 Tax=Gongylonema pulchrum TaxID=637853 RepID=A0A183EGE8_9BILA